MIQKAIIDEADNDYIIIKIKRQCACNNKNDCNVKCFSLGDDTLRVKIKNQNRLKAGDIVEVEAKTSSVLLYAAIVFILPLVTGLTSYFLAQLFFVSELIPYIISGLMFIMSILILYFLLNKFISKKENYKITKI